jgi:hypothetical protein
MRPGFPSPPVSVAQASGPHRVIRMHERGQSLAGCKELQLTLYQWDRWNAPEQPPGIVLGFMSQIDTTSQEEGGRVPLDLAGPFLRAIGRPVFLSLGSLASYGCLPRSVFGVRRMLQAIVVCYVASNAAEGSVRRASLLSKLRQATSTNDRHSSNFRIDRNRFCFAEAEWSRTLRRNGASATR